MRWLALLVTVALLGAPATARADHVDDLIKEVAAGQRMKVQVSAAIALHKTGDPRAIRAFSNFVVNHSEGRAAPSTRRPSLRSVHRLAANGVEM